MTRNRKWRFIVLIASLGVLILSQSAAGCISPALAPETEPGPAEEGAPATIYVSVVSHTEEPTRPQHLHFVGDEKVFRKYRKALLDFVLMLGEEGVKFNFQSDWNFLLAVSLYDNGIPSTNGKNVLRYLTENLCFEVDPHAHESRYNYADVAYLIEQLGVPASPIAGGFIAAPPEDSKLEYLNQPIEGWQYDFTWQAEILWGGATSGHQNEEDLWISGIWKPKDNAHFTVHDDNASLPHIGGYKSDWSGLLDLLEQQQNGELKAGRIYTQTIFVGQREILYPGFVDDFREQIRSLSKYTDDGLAKWVTLSQVIQIWEDEYNAGPNLSRFDSSK